MKTTKVTVERETLTPNSFKQGQLITDTTGRGVVLLVLEVSGNSFKCMAIDGNSYSYGHTDRWGGSNWVPFVGKVTLEQ